MLGKYLINMDKVLRKDNETKILKKIILKYSKDISTYDDRIRGVFSIKNVRIYDRPYFDKFVEVDIEFKGEILVQVSSLKGDTWCDVSILYDEKYKVSKIRLNKFFRNRLINDIKHRLSYFNEDIFYDYQIKKIKWI